MNLSIIIPLYNESESLSELHKLIVDELKTHNLSYEIYSENHLSGDFTYYG